MMYDNGTIEFAITIKYGSIVLYDLPKVLREILIRLISLNPVQLTRSPPIDSVLSEQVSKRIAELPLSAQDRRIICPLSLTLD